MIELEGSMSIFPLAIAGRAVQTARGPNTSFSQLLADVPPFRIERHRKGQTSAASASLFFLFSFQFPFFFWIKLGCFLSFFLALIFLSLIRHIRSSMFQSGATLTSHGLG